MWRLNVDKEAVLKMLYGYYGFIAQEQAQLRAGVKRYLIDCKNKFCSNI